MELGLSLGEASKPFGFVEKARDVSNKTRLGFCMSLSIGSNPRNEPQEDQHQHQHQEPKQDNKEEKHSNNNSIESIDPPLIQLDLLPNTPVVPLNNHPHHHALPWISSDNGNFEVVSSGSMGRGGLLDVNRIPVFYQDAEERAALSSSPPNSAASSFQMDFCIYSKSGNHEIERASSRASDEDENGNTRKKLRLSKEQSAYLEESFKEHNTLNPKQKLALANQLNLRPRQVEVWFQNRRARTKLKQTEVDCEYLKRCCETLTEENRRLHKELQELRALKTTSNPFYMQLPATTLTMCPSCERVATTATATATTTTTPTTTKNINNSSNTTTEPASKTRPRFHPFSRRNHYQPTTS